MSLKRPAAGGESCKQDSFLLYMKRKNSGKQILAIMLALVLTISQYPVYSYAQEENIQEESVIPDEEEAFAADENISEKMPEKAESQEDIQWKSLSEDSEAPEEVFGSEENLQDTETVPEEAEQESLESENQELADEPGQKRKIIFCVLFSTNICEKQTRKDESIHVEWDLSCIHQWETM